MEMRDTGAVQGWLRSLSLRPLLLVGCRPFAPVSVGGWTAHACSTAPLLAFACASYGLCVFMLPASFATDDAMLHASLASPGIAMALALPVRLCWGQEDCPLRVQWDPMQREDA
jgi:hypothetical protein